MQIENAVYIKLGAGGCWEKDSIQNNRIRIGWHHIDIDLIKNGKWDDIKKIIENEYRDKKSGATADFNALKKICTSDETTLFITFYSGKMYWCTAKAGSLTEDTISKYLETQSVWSCNNILNTRVFEMNSISGRLTKYQGFMGTTCSIGNRLNEFEYLKEIITGKESETYKRLYKARNDLKNALIPAIKNLAPKDFEILIDLIFRNLGWKRTSVLGEVMKFFDLVLEEPLSKKLHGVQIKAGTTLKVYEEYRNIFLQDYKQDFASFFFAVHTPDAKLEAYEEFEEGVSLLKTPAIADYAIDSGLITWIMDKSK
jgi:hypothetical protein